MIHSWLQEINNLNNDELDVLESELRNELNKREDKLTKFFKKN